MNDKLTFKKAILDETVYVIPDATKLTNVADTLNQFLFEGGNGKKVSIIYRPAHGNKLDNESKNTLLKVVNALKLTLDDVAIINTEESGYNHFQFINAKLHPTYLLCFGIGPHDLGIRITHEFYKEYSISGVRVIFSHAVEALDKQRKNVLWGRLQEMFQM